MESRTRTVIYEYDPEDRDLYGHIAKAEFEILQAAQIINRIGGVDLVTKSKLDKAYSILADLVPVSYFTV